VFAQKKGTAHACGSRLSFLRGAASLRWRDEARSAQQKRCGNAAASFAYAALWSCIIGSTICGEAADCLVFYPIAFFSSDDDNQRAELSEGFIVGQ
jgi:hypothetical protein